MESSVGENCSQFDFNKTCFKFTKESTFSAVIWCRTAISSLGTLVSLAAILYLLHLKFCKKENLERAGRLALYLCIASLFNGIITAIQIAAVSTTLVCDHVVANNFCTTASTLIGCSVWTILVLMVWIYVEMVMAVFLTSKYQNYRCCEWYKQYRDSKYYDGCVIATTLAIPILFSHIPLKLYGLAGAWCWIKTRDDECHKIVAGVVEQFLLWYAWAMLFIVVFSVTAVVALVIICTRKKKAADAVQYNQYLKGAYLLGVYQIIFALIYGIGFANRIIYAVHKKTILWLWIIHGIADALVSLAIPFLFIISRCLKLTELPALDNAPAHNGDREQACEEPNIENSVQEPNERSRLLPISNQAAEPSM